MKKQILFLSFLVLAVLAGVTNSYGQQQGTIQLANGITCPTPNAIDCLVLDNPLQPVPGTEYTYQVEVPSPNGDKVYNWFATQNTAFISGGTLNTAAADQGDGNGNLVLDVNTTSGSTYLASGTTSNTLVMTWKEFDASAPTFLVIYVTNDDGTLCTTENLKVYKILPQSAFTLDIANVDVTSSTSDPLGWGVTHATCMSDIVSATYDAAINDVDYDYGTNYMYFLVNAANFTDSYQLDIQIDGVNAAEALTADWSYNTATLSWNSLALGGTAGGQRTAQAVIEAQASNDAVGAAGECVIIRLTLDHTTDHDNFFDGTAAQTVSVAVDGNTGTGYSVPDLHYTGGTGVCGVADDFVNDVATHTLNPRPTINAVSPTPLLTPAGVNP